LTWRALSEVANRLFVQRKHQSSAQDRVARGL